MSAPLPIRAFDITITRTGLLATASAIVATTSVAVTLAVTSDGGTDRPAAASAPKAGVAKHGPATHDGMIERRR